MNIQQRVEDMGRSAAILGLWVVIASLGELIRSASLALDGDAVGIVRVALSVLGLAAAGLFWSGRNFGREGMLGILAWGALQIPFIADREDGNYTRQLVEVLAGVTSESTVNGQVTSYSQFGVNLVGIALVVWAVSARKRLELWKARAGTSAA